MGMFRSFNRKTNKYHNHAVIVDKIRFDSRGEGQRYLELKDLKKAGVIKEFELQPQFELQPAFDKVLPNDEKIHYRPISYFADFKVTYPDGSNVIEDVKGKGGFTTPDFEVKRKLFEYKYPELHIEIVNRSGKGMEIFDAPQKDE
jgi:hypothetical protein